MPTVSRHTLPSNFPNISANTFGRSPTTEPTLMLCYAAYTNYHSKPPPLIISVYRVVMMITGCQVCRHLAMVISLPGLMRTPTISWQLPRLIGRIGGGEKVDVSSGHRTDSKVCACRGI
jgi:hypothetical protein